MLASTKILKNLAVGLGALGFDARAVLSRCDLRWEDLEDGGEDRRVPVDVLNRFWAAAVAATGDVSIGVRLGALARIESFGVLGTAARASATLGDALLKTARYMKLWNEATSLSMLVEGDSALVWYRNLSPEPAHPAVGDIVMTMLLAFSRELTGRHLYPHEARFAHPAPADASVYRELFGESPRFDRVEFALVFSAELLTLPLVTHDPGRAEALAERVSRLVDALPAAESYADRVRRVLRAEVRGGNPMIENVAAQLGVHSKTLTRRLRDEGTSHSELLDALRRDLAQQYLSASELNVTEVTFLLGFSNASAFNKAFRRWFGVAPLAYRQRARS